MNLEEMIDFSTHLEECIDFQIHQINEILESYGAAAQQTIEDGLNLIPRGGNNE